DAKNGAVLQADARRSLDLREQHIKLAAQPADLQTPAVQRAVLDLAARIEGDDLAPAGRHEIGRPAKQRGGELAGRHARAFDDRLIIAGEEAVAVAEFADAQ